jgi:hypothetical protein
VCVCSSLAGLLYSVRPTQTALGWDWVLFKMKNLATEEDAAAYLDRKPVPVVKRGDLYYAVDHHHTLAALQVTPLAQRLVSAPAR